MLFGLLTPCSTSSNNAACKILGRLNSNFPRATSPLLYPTVWDRLPKAMKAVFVESREFTEWVAEFLPDDAYAALQQELLEQPDKGDVLPGCGGLRKVRAADPRRHKGKRGGARAIYLYVPEAKWFFMLDIYGKDEKDDLSTAEKKVLSKLVDELKRQARAALGRNTRRKR